MPPKCPNGQSVASGQRKQAFSAEIRLFAAGQPVLAAGPLSNPARSHGSDLQIRCMRASHLPGHKPCPHPWGPRTAPRKSAGFAVFGRFHAFVRTPSAANLTIATIISSSIHLLLKRPLLFLFFGFLQYHFRVTQNTRK